jgi:peptide deformylase
MHDKRDGKRHECQDGQYTNRKKDKYRIEDDAPDANWLYDHLAKIDRFGSLDQNRNMLTMSARNLMSAAQMAVLPILTIPDRVLRKKAKPVERVDADLRRLMDDMLATMYDAPGIGLAAPQIGVLRRLIVMDPAKDEAPKSPIVMVNPEILERSEKMRVHEEGCLSIPEFTAEIERPAKTRVSYIDPQGKKQEAELEGIWSTLAQHEIDHLNGVLFIDYLSRLKRDMIVKKFTKQKRADAL